MRIAEFTSAELVEWAGAASFSESLIGCDGLKAYNFKEPAVLTRSFKLYNDYPPHFAISVAFQLQNLDSFSLSQPELLINRARIPDSFDISRETLCSPVGTAPKLAQAFNIAIFTRHSSLQLSLKISTFSQSLRLLDFSVKLLRCHENCYSCSGPTSADCLKCPAFSRKSAGVCRCNPGYYPDSRAPCAPRGSGNCLVCRVCYTRCLECRGAGPANCTACIPGYSLLKSTCFPNRPNVSAALLRKSRLISL